MVFNCSAVSRQGGCQANNGNGTGKISRDNKKRIHHSTFSSRAGKGDTRECLWQQTAPILHSRRLNGLPCHCRRPQGGSWPRSGCTARCTASPSPTGCPGSPSPRRLGRGPSPRAPPAAGTKGAQSQNAVCGRGWGGSLVVSHKNDEITPIHTHCNLLPKLLLGCF